MKNPEDWKYLAKGYDSQGYCHIITQDDHIPALVDRIKRLYPLVRMIIIWYTETLHGLKGGAPIAGVQRLKEVVFVTTEE